MAKNYDAKQLTINYFKDFEYNCDGPKTGGHIYSVMKYCHPTEFVFKQNGRSDAKGVPHQVQVFALYGAKFKRRYAHEDILTISEAYDIEGKPGCKRVFVERAERCYFKADDNSPEVNYYPALNLPADFFLSIVEFDEDGLMTLMADYYNIQPYMHGSAIAEPTIEELKAEMIACGADAYMDGIVEAVEKARKEIYGA